MGIVYRSLSQAVFGSNCGDNDRDNDAGNLFFREIAFGTEHLHNVPAKGKHHLSFLDYMNELSSD